MRVFIKVLESFCGDLPYLGKHKNKGSGFLVSECDEARRPVFNCDKFIVDKRRNNNVEIQTRQVFEYLPKGSVITWKIEYLDSKIDRRSYTIQTYTVKTDDIISESNTAVDKFGENIFNRMFSLYLPNEHRDYTDGSNYSFELYLDDRRICKKKIDFDLDCSKLKLVEYSKDENSINLVIDAHDVFYKKPAVGETSIFKLFHNGSEETIKTIISDGQVTDDLIGNEYDTPNPRIPYIFKINKQFIKGVQNVFVLKMTYQGGTCDSNPLRYDIPAEPEKEIIFCDSLVVSPIKQSILNINAKNVINKIPKDTPIDFYIKFFDTKEKQDKEFIIKSYTVKTDDIATESQNAVDENSEYIFDFDLQLFGNSYNYLNANSYEIILKTKGRVLCSKTVSFENLLDCTNISFSEGNYDLTTGQLTLHISAYEAFNKFPSVNDRVLFKLEKYYNDAKQEEELIKTVVGSGEPFENLRGDELDTGNNPYIFKHIVNIPKDTYATYKIKLEHNGKECISNEISRQGEPGHITHPDECDNITLTQNVGENKVTTSVSLVGPNIGNSVETVLYVKDVSSKWTEIKRETTTVSEAFQNRTYDIPTGDIPVVQVMVDYYVNIANNLRLLCSKTIDFTPVSKEISISSVPSYIYDSKLGTNSNRLTIEKGTKIIPHKSVFNLDTFVRDTQKQVEPYTSNLKADIYTNLNDSNTILDLKNADIDLLDHNKSLLWKERKAYANYFSYEDIKDSKNSGVMNFENINTVINSKGGNNKFYINIKNNGKTLYESETNTLFTMKPRVNDVNKIVNFVEPQADYRKFLGGVVHRIDKGTQNEGRLLYIKGFHFEMDPENKRMIDKDSRDGSNYYLTYIKYDLKLLRISYDDSNNIQHISETILDNTNNSNSLTHESENTNESYTMEYTSSPIDLDAKIQELRNSDTTNYTKENFITYYVLHTHIFSNERDIFLKVGNAVVYRSNQTQYLNETIWDI